MTEERPDPDQLLREVQQEERQKTDRRGRLKIFFGYAAGVGKTYAMLDTARGDMASGADVAAGYVEPHARPETMALLEGVEQLPPRLVEYKNITLRELDLDAALKRRPQIILVDELAHTNARGGRHKKRYQDVAELLDAGIDVYTTVNVQHLESLHDIVASITHIRVNERIPDYVFDDADKVELIDIEPEELLKRMDAGKIYKKEQADRAVSHFFTKENLTALRGIALRRTADRVNRAAARERTAGGNGYYTGEHILVCLSPSPTNAKVIRTAARIAGAFNAELTAVLVETQEIRDNAKLRRGAEENMALARQFQAPVAILGGEDVAVRVGEFARENGVSKIVIGRAVKKGGLFRVKPDLIDRLIGLVPNMDIYVIPDPGASIQKKQKRAQEKPAFREAPADLAKTAVFLGAATLLGTGLEEAGLGEMNVVMVYMMSVVLTAYFVRFYMFGVAASVASVLLYNFFFTEPKFTFRAEASIYPFTFLAMLLCALIISSLAGRLKKEAAVSRMEARRMHILIQISNKMKMAESADEILDICAKQVMGLLNRSVVVYDTSEGYLDKRRVYLAPEAEESDGDILLEEAESAVASWVMKNCHKAGRGTGTLPGAAGYYIPIAQEGEVYAVLGIRMGELEALPQNDRNILHVMINETAISIRSRHERRPAPAAGKSFM